MRLLVIALLAVLLLACGRPGPEQKAAVMHVPQDMVVPRPQYDTSRPFRDLVKPHFYATSSRGELVEASGEPDLVLVREGKVKVRLRDGGQERYLDLLALESEALGEHPVHKVFRLQAMGVRLEERLARRLQPEDFDDSLFHTLRFQYLQGKETSGVIAEVFHDGTFLVIPFETPEEWRSSQPSIASPTHFHVDPRALIAGDSALAAEFEREILALPFNDQRYPPASITRKECDLYRQGREGQAYQDILSAIGYRFTPAHAISRAEAAPASFPEELSLLLWEGAGRQTRYFGFDGYWIADRLRDLKASWIGECDTAGGMASYQAAPGQNGHYITVRRSLEPDIKRRYQVVSIAGDGSGRVLYTAPGIILMSQPLPFDSDRWVMSVEGWGGPGENSPADPRWQSVYIVNMASPEEYRVVSYPLSQFPRAPAGGLYGASVLVTADGKFMFNTLYGFKDEGGGLWVTDLSRRDFFTDPSAFSRLIAWDHALSWFVLEVEEGASHRAMYIFLTGKEVADDFAMTANILRVKLAGLQSSVERAQRILQMVGWNPVPFAIQRLGDHTSLVAVEANLSFQDSLLPRATGVYIVPVDTEQYQ